uniref:RING-type domain-containing protein n=1 Tax=Kalanchoe fedtschenkoi TaxID=63787 RepID=A0A7N0ZV75_KALFE
MELDLDSFLQTISDDEDDLLTSIPRRTVDDILNDSDSSSSSSSFQLTSVVARGGRDEEGDDSVSPSSTSDSRFPETSTDVKKPTTFPSRIRQGQFSAWDSTGRASRPLPALFGSVRSNSKPGVALAAAAAASRAVPTPYAAAIKLRRAGSESLQGSLWDHDEPRSGVADSNYELNSWSEVSDPLVAETAQLAGAPWKDDNKMDNPLCPVAENNAGCSQEDDTISDSLHPSIKTEDVIDGVSFESSDAQNNISDVVALNETGEKNLDNRFPESICQVNPDMGIPLADYSSSADEVGSAVLNSSEENLDLNPAFVEPSVHGSILDPDLVPSAPGSDEKKQGDSEFSLNEASLDGENTEAVEDMLAQWTSKRSQMDVVKEIQTNLKPLEMAELLEKKHASAGLHWAEGAASQPMRLEGVRRGSIALGYFDIDVKNTITQTISAEAFMRDYGSAQVLAVHPNYLAVGTSKGFIAVLPSKYSAQNVNSLDGKISMLGTQGDKSNSSVTSMCFNQQGDLLLVGYEDGHITIWDVQRSSVAKIISGDHNAPVVIAFFLGQDSQVTRQFKAVTGDSKGLVLLHTSSVLPLFGRFTIKTQCLLDGQRTGTVVAASPLLFDEYSGSVQMTPQGNSMGLTSGIGTMMGGVGDAGWKLFSEGSNLAEEGVVAFVSQRAALVVRLSTNVEFYAQLSRPEGVREGSMPYIAWRCMAKANETTSVEAADKVSLLAIAWDKKVQVAKLVKPDIKVYRNWTLDSAAIGLAWLDDQMLVVLTVTGQLCLFAEDGNLIHQTSFWVDQFSGDDPVGYHTHFNNIFGNPEKAFHNCLAVRGANIYLLAPMHLTVARLLPWKERIQVLRKGGDWMGALNMAMTLYDGQFHGVIDLPRTLDSVHAAIMPYLVELLLSYVDEVFSYISVAFCNQLEKMDESSLARTSLRSEIKEQFTRVGGVAVEFCVHIKRTDILFDEILPKFIAVQQKDTFLELLEPYILRDMLGALPPEIMQALVEHYSSRGWLQRVEQCVLHMDISSVDFNQVVKLCREHGLHSALIYLFNRGLRDYKAPLEELLVVLQDSRRETAGPIGYRMLVYLKYCFSGQAFPPGHGSIASSHLPSIRAELVQFLLDASKSPTNSVLDSKGAYPNLYHLLVLDTEATLDVMKCAFVESEVPEAEVSPPSGADAMKTETDDYKTADFPYVLVQQTVDALVHLIEESFISNKPYVEDEVWPTKKDAGYIFEFIAYYIAHQRCKVSRIVICNILDYLASDSIVSTDFSANEIDLSKKREKQVLSLLEVVPQDEWDASYILNLCERARFFQVCGFIFALRHNYVSALDSYMKDVNEPVHAFSFISKTLLLSDCTEVVTFRSAVMSRIPDLIVLSREATFLLIIDHFSGDVPLILTLLRSHPKSLFLYLKTAIEVHLHGTLNMSSLKTGVDLYSEKVKNHSHGLDTYLERFSELPKLLRNSPIQVSDEMIELYFEMLCKYERNSVLKFLETVDNYRVEYCLHLCQEYGIVDAAAFLLERVGDVGSALSLTLSRVNDTFVELEKALERILAFNKCSSFDSVLEIQEVDDIYKTLHACIGMCQRNTKRLDAEDCEALWLQLLDTFCDPLMAADSKWTFPKDKNDAMPSRQSSVEIREGTKNKWRISKTSVGANIERRLFSQFIKEIIEGMLGYVRLPAIIAKLLSDNGSQEFGDFKLTILGVLGTYGFERHILDTAKSLIEDDTFYTMSLLKKAASHGYAPRKAVCCICNCPLSKYASNSSVQIFHCGHVTHTQCEFSENDYLEKSVSSGCPICTPMKRSQRSRSKSVLSETGPINRTSSNRQQVQGSHIYESEATDHYGIHHISRFEILHNLQKEPRSTHLENMPQLRLAPPAVYHEKIQKDIGLMLGETSNSISKIDKPARYRQFRELKLKGSTIRFPLKSNMFGKDKAARQ